MLVYRAPDLLRFHPNLTGYSLPQMDGPPVYGERQGLVVVLARTLAVTPGRTPNPSRYSSNWRSRSYTLTTEIVECARLSSSGRHPLLPAIIGSIDAHQVTVWARRCRAEILRQLAFKIRRDRVFQLFRLIVNLIPFHTKNFCQHAFDEMMAHQNTIGYVAAFRGQGYLSLIGNLNEAVPSQALDRHGDSGRRNGQPSGQCCSLYILTFRFGLSDGLEVILLRDRDLHA